MKIINTYLFLMLLPFLFNGIAKADDTKTEESACSVSCQKGSDECFAMCDKITDSRDTRICKLACTKGSIACKK